LVEPFPYKSLPKWNSFESVEVEFATCTFEDFTVRQFNAKDKLGREINITIYEDFEMEVRMLRTDGSSYVIELDESGQIRFTGI